MSKFGFWLTGIVLTGEGVPDASVFFSKGLNVVSGPSDTGKTFIFSCIDFMFGAKRVNKMIPEAKPYEYVHLGLGYSNREIILQRCIRGGDVNVFEDSLYTMELENKKPSFVLAEKHAPDKEDTLSFFLLKLSGLADKYVRTNAKGKVRQISFRDIAKLIAISEQNIIKEYSPILRGQYTTETVDSSVFGLLLTGLDDSSLILKDKSFKVSHQQRTARKQVLEELITSYVERLDALGLTEDLSDIHQRLEVNQNRYNDALDHFVSIRQNLESMEEKRKELWASIKGDESRLIVINELQERFVLLKKQYRSDLERLVAINETQSQLAYLERRPCPLCGLMIGDPEEVSRDHSCNNSDNLDIIAQSCQAEAKKIQGLLNDLEKMLDENDREIHVINTTVFEKRQELSQLIESIERRLRPNVQEMLDALRKYQENKDTYNQAMELTTSITTLRDMVSTLENATNRKNLEIETNNADEIEVLCIEIEKLLRKWNFPNLEGVTFSEEYSDIVISGKSRSSYGKGTRAVTHSAFSLGLLKLLTKNGQPHPGVVILDSPLVVYRQPDKGEDNITVNLKETFYYELAKQFCDKQVIIFENEDPPVDLKKATVIRFTGTDVGRKAFIPEE